MPSLSSFYQSTLRTSSGPGESWVCRHRPHTTRLVPELDDYLKPDQARERFAIVPTLKIVAVDEAKHLWLGEPSVYRVLSEITSIVTGKEEKLPLEF